MVAVILLPSGTSCSGTLARRRLTPERAPLPLRTAEVLVGKLMRKTGSNVIGVVSTLTLLVGRLRCWKILLLILALVLILLLLAVLLRILAGHEVTSASSICRRSLKLGSDIVIVALTTRVLEDWLWKGRGSGRVNTFI